MPDLNGGASADSSAHVAAIVLRLKQLEAQRSQQGDAVFFARVAVEVRSAMERVAPENRAGFLEDIQAQFPDWELGENLELDEGAAENGESDGQGEIDQLIGRLIALLPEMSGDQRDAVADQLGAAGLVPGDGAVWRADVLAAMATGLGLRNGEIPDPNRVAELVLLMVEFSGAIQQLTWATWRTIAPHATIKRGGVVQKSVAKFVSGQDMARDQVAADFTALRHLIASIISGVSDVGHQFAASHLARFMPAEIESAVDAEGGKGMFKSKAAACWEKYAELSETLEPSAIESEIRRVIAEHAEHLLKGLGNWHMKLTELCEPLFQYVCLLNRSARKGAAYDRDQVRGELEMMFADMAGKAATDPALRAQYELVEAPLLFFVDGTIRESSLPFAHDWHDMARDRSDLRDSDGGAEFFDMLDDTLRDQSYAAMERLAIFYSCMGLGFTGWYSGQPEFLRKRMLEIATRTRSPTEVDSASRIVPEAYEHVNTSNLIDPPGGSLLGIGITLVGLVVVLFATNLSLYRSTSQNLNNAIGNIIDMDKGPDDVDKGRAPGAAAQNAAAVRSTDDSSDAR